MISVNDEIRVSASVLPHSNGKSLNVLLCEVKIVSQHCSGVERGGRQTIFYRLRDILLGCHACHATLSFPLVSNSGSEFN